MIGRRDVLLLGFSLFNGYHYNTCEEVVNILRDTELMGFKIIGIVVPVSLSYIRQRVVSFLEELRPSIVIGLGMAPKATSILIELGATNIAYFDIPDVDEYKARGEELYTSQPLVVETSLPVKEILIECMERKQLKIRPSLSTGTYLCNALAYTIMSYAKRYGVIGGFLHIPPHTDYAMRMKLENYLPLYEIVEAIKCVINTCIKKLLEYTQK